MRGKFGGRGRSSPSVMSPVFHAAAWERVPVAEGVSLPRDPLTGLLERLSVRRQRRSAKQRDAALMEDECEDGRLDALSNRGRSGHPMRHPTRAALWFMLTALVVYAAPLALALGVVLATGDGVSCRGDCGAVSEWLGDARPYQLVGAIVLAVAVGLVVARQTLR